jgi:ankyrin repeat protein
MEAAGLSLLRWAAAALVGAGLLLAGCEQKTPDDLLIQAVRKNDAAEVDRLLASGANPNADKVKGSEGRPPLFHAATFGYVQIAQKLIAKGAKVNAGADTGGVTPLMMASLNGNSAMIELLIQSGADVNAREGKTGSTALTEAVRKGDAPVLALLLNAGADPNVPMEDGRAPICYSRAMRYEQAAQLLAQAGALGNC